MAIGMAYNTSHATVSIVDCTVGHASSLVSSQCKKGEDAV